MANEKGNTERKAELKKKAYQLRIAGLSYRKIGEQLGINFQTAFNYVKETLDNLRRDCTELAETYRDMELVRLDEMQTAIYTKILKGDLNAIDRLLRVMERRSRLLGLDAPKQIEVDSKTIDIVIKKADED